MRAHKRNLHSAKNQACHLCEYRTYSSFNLKLHLSKMHNAPSLQALCPVCQVKTHSLDWHIRVFHPVFFDEQLKLQLAEGVVVHESAVVGEGGAAVISIQMGVE